MLGEEENKGKWDLSRDWSGFLPQCWERRNTKENGIFPEFVAGILTCYWDWRGRTRRKNFLGRNWAGGECRAPPQSSDLEVLDAPNLSVRIHLPWQGGAGICLIPIFPSSRFFNSFLQLQAVRVIFFFPQIWKKKQKKIKKKNP